MKMKTVHVFFVLAIAGIIAFTGCDQSKPVKTIKNLKEGIIGETTASKKYEAFAQKAREEGYDTIAILFDAASKAEAIHASNHKKVLEELGETMEDFTPEFEVKTTAENLQAAKAENVPKAEKSFNWALDTEKKHNNFYSEALDALNMDSENILPAGYAVCPVCGNTYDISNVDEKCAFCQTDKSKFINFNL